jgi:hypothetical protein
MGEWRYIFTILDPASTWRCVAGFTKQALYFKGKDPHYPVVRRLPGHQR